MKGKRSHNRARIVAPKSTKCQQPVKAEAQNAFAILHISQLKTKGTI